MVASPPPPAAPKALGLSVKEFAALLGVHENTIRRWWTRGLLEGERYGPKLIRIPRSELARMRKFAHHT